MSGDPYSAIWLRRRRNQARAEGGLAVLAAVGLPLAAALLLVPLVRPLFLSFLDGDPVLWAEGLRAVSVRAALVVVGWLSLDLYTAIVRGPDRDVLAILPVDAARVVRSEVVRIAVERWWLPAGAALVLGPMAWVDPRLWGLAMAVVLGAWALGLTASAMVHLLAIEVAESERWAPVLDLVRGNNPRPQAAFLYAPGVVLGLSGLLVVQSSGGARSVYAGNPFGAVWLVLPWIAAVLAWLPVSRLARRTWFRGSAVLAEIDARYATLQDPDEALRVYLDWVVRFLPAELGRYVLKDLRHGWRARRTLIVLAWAIGLLGLGAAWTEDPIGAARASVVVVFGAFFTAAVSALMDRDEPPFLWAWLPDGGGARLGARVLVLAAWVAPCWVPGTLALLLRRGADEAVWLAGIGVGATAAAILLALTCGRLRERAIAVYGPLAAVLAAALATLVGTTA